jgi:hypothetical protein
LTYIGGAAFAILYWINSTGVKAPVTVPLDSTKLRRASGSRTVYFYSGVTVDPRYVDSAIPE